MLPMSEPSESLMEETAKATGLSVTKLNDVLEAFFEGLHRRMYEYDRGNGAYVTEELSFEISDRAWIHLYQFLLLDRLRHGCQYPDDEISDSIEQLMYMGGPAQWRPFFEEMASWQMSPRFGLDRPLYS
jgi:hypothetical protein